MDNAVGASALSQRRLMRALEAGDSHVLIYAGSSKLVVADCGEFRSETCAQSGAHLSRPESEPEVDLLLAHAGTGKLVECDHPHEERVSALAASSEHKIAVTGGPDKKLVVWELPSMKIRSQVSTDKKVVALALDRACEQVVIADKAGEVFGKPMAALDTPSKHLLGHISSLTDMCLSPSGNRLLTADRDEKVTRHLSSPAAAPPHTRPLHPEER
jgi:WD40 repeat protein